MSSKTPDMDHNCIGRGCRHTGCENNVPQRQQPQMRILRHPDGCACIECIAERFKQQNAHVVLYTVNGEERISGPYLTRDVAEQHRSDIAGYQGVSGAHVLGPTGYAEIMHDVKDGICIRCGKDGISMMGFIPCRPQVISTAAPHRSVEILSGATGLEPPFALSASKHLAVQPQMRTDCLNNNPYSEKDHPLGTLWFAGWQFAAQQPHKGLLSGTSGTADEQLAEMLDEIDPAASAATLPRDTPLQDFSARQVYDALCALDNAAQIVHERLFIIQPYLNVYREHGAVITAVLTHCGKEGGQPPAAATQEITRNTAARLRTFCLTLLESGLSAERKLGGELAQILKDGGLSAVD